MILRDQFLHLPSLITLSPLALLREGAVKGIVVLRHSRHRRSIDETCEIYECEFEYNILRLV